MRARAFDGGEIRRADRRPAAPRAELADSQPSLPHATGRSAPFGWMMARTGSDSARHHSTSVTSPNVQIIAMPEPFSGSASSCASTGTRTRKSGVSTSVPKSGAIPLVGGMRDEGHARRNQLGPRRFDLDAASCRVGESNPMIRARLFAIFELGLRHRRTEIDIPQRRRLELVRQASLKKAHERQLGDALRPLVDRCVGHPPVDGQAEVRHSASKAFSSSAVSCAQSAMKFGRETEIGCFGGLSGGWNDGSYGSDGSQRTPK